MTSFGGEGQMHTHLKHERSTVRYEKNHLHIAI